MLQQQKINGRMEAMDALEGILSQYPRIHTADIERFAPVYYPIAIIELEMEEQTFEDFAVVQMTVLQLFYLGVTDHKVIAQTLGLSPNYVYKILRLLHGYGHISGGSITLLGLQSLTQKQKVATTTTLQKFQMDALNGTLLKVGQTITDNALSEIKETKRIIGHLDYLDGISTADLSSQLTGSAGEAYLHQKSGILHTNVTAIKNARCVQIQYAKCYLLKPKGQEHPIVFAKRYDKSQKNIKDRFSWQPFSVYSEWFIRRFGFDPDTRISTDQANRYVTDLYNMMLEHSKTIDLIQEVNQAIPHIYPFSSAGLRANTSTGTRVARLSITAPAITQYRGSLVNILMGIHKDEEYLYTNEHLFGHLISLDTDDPKLLYLADLLAQKVEEHGLHALKRELRERLSETKGEANFLDAIVREIQNLDNMENTK